MKIKTIILVLFLLGVNTLFLSFSLCQADNLVDRTQEQIKKIIETSGKKFVCHGEIICGTLVIPQFYERRQFKPAWTDEKGLRPQVKTLVESLHESHLEGLRTEDYHHDVFEKLIGELESKGARRENLDPVKLAELDILLTDVFLMYSSHLLAGRVNPETVHTEWIPFVRSADLSSVLEQALENDQIDKKLKSLLPPHRGYANLKKALVHYRELAQNGGWPVVAAGPTLHKNDTDSRVKVLRKRLIVSGDMSSDKEVDSDIFDAALYEGVKIFQKRHGLAVDGVVGKNTLGALNKSSRDRARQIELNLERWRWLPQDFGKRYVLVNIASFELHAVDNDKKVLDMRVVVGKPYRRTPVFSSKIKHMTVNPYWNVPYNLAVKDILPKVRRNPGYLTAKKIKVYRGSTSINPYGVNWSAVSAQNFPYRFRQEPGPKNALGRIKFIFPNKFSVYLHDTPSRKLFSRSKRTFSSGCIRVHKPFDLAEFLLKNNPAWNVNKVQSVIKSKKTQVIKQSHDVFVHLVYWTAWVDETGKVQFRDDIYERDKRLDRALKEKLPLPMYTTVDKQKRS